MLLLGRVTYDGFSAAWPERGGDFADKMNGMRKVVASTTLEDPEWNNTTVIRDVAGEVAALKEEDGGPILVAGSRTLVQSLMEHDLVDEYCLLIFPVVLGSGARLFPESEEKRPLELVDSRTFSSGVTAQTYRPVRA
jgi:dihydrofolate reductase